MSTSRYYAYLQIFGGKNLLNLKFLFNFAPTKEEWRSLAPISIYRRALSLLFFIGTAVVTKEEWLLLVQYLCCRNYDALGLMLFALCQL